MDVDIALNILFIGLYLYFPFWLVDFFLFFVLVLPECDLEENTLSWFACGSVDGGHTGGTVREGEILWNDEVDLSVAT